MTQKYSCLVYGEGRKDKKFLQKLIIAVRNIRGEMNISPNKPLSIYIANHTEIQINFIQNNITLIKTIGKLENLIFIDDKTKAPP